MSDDYMIDGIKVNWPEAEKLHNKLTMSGISKTIELVRECADGWKVDKFHLQ